MKSGIVGSGRIGSGLGALWARMGHRVVMGSCMDKPQSAPEAAGVLMSMNSSIVQLGMAAGAVTGGLVAGASMAAVGMTAAAAVAIATAIAGVSLRYGHGSLKLSRAES